MSVNYTLLEFEEGLMEHPFGLTESETWDYEQYITDYWEDMVHFDDLQQLEESVEDFISWLSESDNSPFENKELWLKSLVDSEI